MEGLEVVHVPLDDLADIGSWRWVWDEGLDGTPLYYRPFLERKPERCAAVVGAVADARPGGVLVHCSIGRDRAGLVAMLLLALAGVAPADIADDYELSNPRLAPLRGRAGAHRVGPGPAEALASQGTSAGAVIEATLAAVDVEGRPPRWWPRRPPAARGPRPAARTSYPLTDPAVRTRTK